MKKLKDIFPRLFVFALGIAPNFAMASVESSLNAIQH